MSIKFYTAAKVNKIYTGIKGLFLMWGPFQLRQLEFPNKNNVYAQFALGVSKV